MAATRILYSAWSSLYSRLLAAKERKIRSTWGSLLPPSLGALLLSLDTGTGTIGHRGHVPLFFSNGGHGGHNGPAQVE